MRSMLNNGVALLWLPLTSTQSFSYETSSKCTWRYVRNGTWLFPALTGRRAPLCDRDLERHVLGRTLSQAASELPSECLPVKCIIDTVDTYVFLGCNSSPRTVMILPCCVSTCTSAWVDFEPLISVDHRNHMAAVP